ncbi:MULTISPECIES: AraC family transcriptional regulator [Nocardia]|uniref:Helix-turn-helix domain-containing protein n=1 Tax=Nocardia implantans TaxID=3108168 RepID=A0ABU6B0Z8_9NOCA|nr:MULTISPECIES: helix-turn-helix domain-containing protein [unclassified Nocardia]MBF6195500.1 AraC family transcriptional regulator [Nocardia beijingensis]MEA3531990.1 helix-turn-helix domain-containing protein [Nocardia sp. CDC192]MEB3513420.1 helix-turn-helix domain-containing protein [Nocardia sp. CDC186]
MEPTTEVMTARPAPALAGFIDRYLGYRMAGFSAGIHRGLPSRHMTFIVAIGPTIDVVEQTDPRQSPQNYRCVLSGLQASTALIAHGGYQEGVAVSLTPLGCRILFGMPAAALWDTSVEFADVVGPVGSELWERLQYAPSWPERFGVCDRVLSALADPDRAVGPELTRAWRAVVGSGGGIAVGSLADEIGWTRQHLTRRFHREFGLSPKLAARITRFERARRMLAHTPSYVTIAQVAAACGYYDQAHLDRDFADLAGTSPTAWLAEEVTSVQAPDESAG